MKIKSIRKKLIIAAAALIAVLGIVISNILGSPAVYSPEKYKKLTVHETAPASSELTADTGTEGYKLIASESGISLEFDFKRDVFSLSDTLSGYHWYSDVKPEMLPGHDFAERPVDFCFSMTVSNNANGNTLVTNSSAADDRSYSGLENGASCTYSFIKYGISVTVQYYLSNGGFCCRIPVDAISEQGDYSLLSIDLLPFFGASVIGEDGYILYPDGCGALYNLSETGSGASGIITEPVYAEHVTDVEKLLQNRSRDINSVRLPVFGVKRSQNAFAAMITDGDVSASISLSPSGCVYDLNRVYATSVYRRVQATDASDGTTYYDTEKEMRGNDFCVRYCFLSGENADYSGMANKIRDLMLSTGRLPEAAERSYDSYLELLMGVRAKSLLGARYNTVTSARQAQQMLDELLTEGSRASVTLLGWQKEGYGVSPSTAKAAGGAGRISEITNSNAEINLSYSTVLANTSSTGAGVRRDAISSLRGITLMDDSGESFILNPVRVDEFFEGSFKKLLSFGQDGLLLSGAAELIYDDYNKKGGITRSATAEVLTGIFEKVRGAGQSLVLENANAYAYPFASLLVKMPEGGSGYQQLKTSVPFLYMVLHGSVNYALDTAGNFSPDFRTEYLRWIEYGAIPYFVLTHDSSDELVATAAQQMFSTQLEEKRQEVKDTLSDFTAETGKIAGEHIESHRIITEKLRVVKYSNGVSIYINYGNVSAQIDGVTVGAEDYLIVG